MMTTKATMDKQPLICFSNFAIEQQLLESFGKMHGLPNKGADQGYELKCYGLVVCEMQYME